LAARLETDVRLRALETRPVPKLRDESRHLLVGAQMDDLASRS